MFRLGSRSLGNLKGVNCALEWVVRRAIRITKQDFTVIEGLRTRERQRELVRTGFSRTMNSRHLTGHAVDIVPYPIPRDWNDYKDHHWDEIARAMKQAADELGVDLEWGYDKWGWDKPHYQLSWKTYP